MGKPYSVQVKRHDGTTTIRLGGEIDAAAGPDVRAAVADSILDRPDRLVIDLTDLTFLDSTGFHALHYARDATEAVRAALEIIVGPKTPMRVLEVTAGVRFENLHSHSRAG